METSERRAEVGKAAVCWFLCVGWSCMMGGRRAAAGWAGGGGGGHYTAPVSKI